MFSMISSRPHSARKRLVSHLYSKSHLQSSPLIERINQEIICCRMLPLLASFAKENTAFDAYMFNHGVAMDFITAYIFGLKHSTHFIRNHEARDEWQRAFMAPRSLMFWYGELPSISWLLSKILRRPVPTQGLSALGDIEDWLALRCISAASDYIPSSADIEKGSNVQSVFTALTRALNPPGIQPFATSDPQCLTHTDKLIASELLDHTVAGQETSGLTLTSLIFEMSKRPDLQARLRQELLILSPSIAIASHSKGTKPPRLPTSRDIDSLPLLHAVIMETLRICVPITGPQPRVTPSGARLVGSPPLPANVRVSCQAYSLHRNSDVFPDPESWRPERWLVDEVGKEKIDEMMKWFWAFGSGGRMCVGSNFAMMDLKLVVASLYTNFRTVIADDGEGKWMEPVLNYITLPKGRKLMIRVEEVSPVKQESRD